MCQYNFKDEDNYVKMQMGIVASLSAATAKKNAPASDVELHRIINVAQTAGSEFFSGWSAIGSGYDWMNHILWVDDRPENNIYERQAFGYLGFRFTLASSTGEALEALSQTKYAAIISDMERREGPREGYVLLDRLRKEGNHTPLFFYASSNAPELKRETLSHGGQGCTNNPQELFEMVTRAVIMKQTA